MSNPLNTIMLADFGHSVILFIFIAILLAIGIFVQAQIATTITTLTNTVNASNTSQTLFVSAATNASNAALLATATFPAWLQIIAVVIGASVVLGILAKVFGFSLSGFGSSTGY